MTDITAQKPSCDGPIDVAVIGGGIIGLAAAEKLIDEGHHVTLIEREHVAAGASAGNAAGLAFSDIMPLASPGIFGKAIKWFFDPLGPFAVVPKDLPWLMGWLLRFAWAARPAQFQRSINVQANLMDLTRACWPAMLDRTGLQDMKTEDGALHLFESHTAFKEALTEWQHRKDHNIHFETYEGAVLHDFQPGLSDRFVAGIYTRDWHNISNPKTLCEALHQRLTDKGLVTLKADVDDIRLDTDGQVILVRGAEKRIARKLVIAAGPWSGDLTRILGDKVPVIGERGYNTTLPKEALALERTLVLDERGFVISSLADGIRVGGASEIARLGGTANYKRSRNMLKIAAECLPGLKTENGEEWMGARPSMPDTLPVISQSSASANIIYAFGHGHLGLTQSAGTAQLVADLVAERDPSMDIYPLRATRF